MHPKMTHMEVSTQPLPSPNVTLPDGPNKTFPKLGQPVSDKTLKGMLLPLWASLQADLFMMDVHECQKDDLAWIINKIINLEDKSWCNNLKI